MSGLHTVHVRVNDAATGKPTACRIRFVGPDGTYYPPFGHPADFATAAAEDVGGNLFLDPARFAYLDGTCEVQLPSTPVSVEVFKGPEYLPIRRDVTLGPGKISLRLQLERWTDSRIERWYSGDVRVHDLSPHAALLEGAAEDVAVVNLLAREQRIRRRLPRKDYDRVSNMVAFSGQKAALEAPGHLVVVNTFNTGWALGSLALLNSHRPVYPLNSGSEDELGSWTLSDWADQCHRKGGLVIWSDPDPEPIPCRIDSEAIADLILGKIDAIEVCSFPPDEYAFRLTWWYRLLDCGIRVPIVGSSAKASNSVPLGCVRTYARLQPDEAFSYKTWIEAVRAGRTVVSNGPVLSFTVDGHDPGAILATSNVGRKLQLRAEARSLVPFARLEIILNGTVIAEAGVSSPFSIASIETELVAPENGGWLAARCRGSELVPGCIQGGQVIAAHSSPVYLTGPEGVSRADAKAIETVAYGLSLMRKRVEKSAKLVSPKVHAAFSDIFEQASERLLKRLEP